MILIGIYYDDAYDVQLKSRWAGVCMQVEDYFVSNLSICRKRGDISGKFVLYFTGND